MARNGYLDLQAATFDRLFPLRGTWLAHRAAGSAVFASYDYDDAAWQPAQIESYFKAQGFPDEGLVWYRLHLRLPPDAPPLKAFLQHANNAHAIYVARAGQAPALVAASGWPAATAQQTILSRKPVTFTLPRDTTVVLSWAVANYNYRNGGPFYAITLGAEDAVNRVLLARLGIVFSSFGLYVLFGLAFLLYGVLNRWDLRSIAMGFVGIVMALRTLAISGALEHLFPVAFDFDLRIALEATSYFALLAGLAFLFWSFFPKEIMPLSFLPARMRGWGQIVEMEGEGGEEFRPTLPAWLRWINTGAVLVAMATGTVFTLLSWLASPEITSHLLAVVRWVTLLLLAVLLLFIIEALERRRPLAGWVAFGGLLLLVGGAHDVLLAMGRIKGHPYVASYAFLGFVLVQGYAVSRRMDQERRRSEERLRLALASATAGTWELHLASGRAYWSEEIYALHGWDLRSPSRFFADWEAMLSPADRAAVERRLDEVREGRSREFMIEVPFTHPTRGRRWMAVVGQVSRGALGRPVRLSGISLDVTERKQAELQLQQMNETLERLVHERTAALAQRTQEVRALASSLTLAEQQERRRISHMLHDDLQQQLYALKIKADLVKQEEANTNQRELVEQMDLLLEAAIRTTRSLTVELSPPVLKGDVGSALRWLAYRMEDAHGLTVALDVQEITQPMSEELRGLLFQLVRELLFNVVKHAQVNEARVALYEAGGNLVVKVEDDGAGFEAGEVQARKRQHEGFGLFSVRERLALFGGRVEVDTAPGAGTRITITLPLSTGLEMPSDDKPS